MEIINFTISILLIYESDTSFGFSYVLFGFVSVYYDFASFQHAFRFLLFLCGIGHGFAQFGGRTSQMRATEISESACRIESVFETKIVVALDAAPQVFGDMPFFSFYKIFSGRDAHFVLEPFPETDFGHVALCRHFFGSLHLALDHRNLGLKIGALLQQELEQVGLLRLGVVGGRRNINSVNLQFR